MSAVFRRFSIVAAALAAFAGGSARALEIDYQFDPNRHNRFLSGFSTNPVQNPNVLGMPGLDFSGVGWGSGGEREMNVALVTPQHFISANHYHPSVGSLVNFLGSDGIVRSYQVQSYIQLHFNPNDNTSNFSDLIVGQLSAPISASDHITNYAVVRPGPFQYPLSNTPQEYIDFYKGREMVVVGKNETGGTDADADGFNDRGGKIAKNIIDDIFNYNFGTNETNTVGVGYWSPPNTQDSGRLVGGDSGSPSFLLYDGQLTALGAHSGIDTSGSMQYNVDSFLPNYIDQINSLIAGTGFQLRVLTPVPEPGILALVGVAGAAWGFARWRRRVVA